MREYFFGITDKGKCRDKNEDSFIVRELDDKGSVIACVIDGVGGYTGGEVAAAIAKDVIIKNIQKTPPDIINTLKEVLISANNSILAKKRKDAMNEQMACVLTCVLADIKNNKLYYAHVGDTRLYLLRDKSLVKLSRDHSAIGFLEESGRLTEEEAMRHPKRNEINKALGFDENIAADFIETGESPFLPGDMILICSDGLSDMIASNIISSILSKNDTLADSGKALINAANDAGGNDNITAVLVKNYNQPKPKTVLKPADRKTTTEKPALQVIKNTAKQSTGKKRPTQSLVTIVAVFLLGFLAVILFQNNTIVKKKDSIPLPKTIDNTKKDLAFMIGQLNDSVKKYTITNEYATWPISTAIHISNDSLIINGNGITLTADSNYKGAAIVIPNSAGQIVIDSLILKNFDAGLIVQKNNVILRNVRFINCLVPIQYELSFKDSIISGRLKDSILLPVSNSKLH